MVQNMLHQGQYQGQQPGMHLTARDLAILRELDMDCRRSNTQIAKATRLSKNIVNYRIQRLEHMGVIQGYHTLINTAQIGKIYARLFFRLEAISDEDELRIIKDVTIHQDVVFCASQEGYWDLVAVTITDTIGEAYAIFMDIAHTHAESIMQKELSIALELRSFRKNHIWHGRQIGDRTPGVIRHGEKDAHIDETDKTIINSLSRDARIGIMDLATKAKISVPTAMERIRKLKETGVIQRFSATIQSAALGYQYFHVFVTLNHADAALDMAILEYLSQQPHVTYITKAISRFDIEFEVEMKTHGELYDFIKRFKKTFTHRINEVESTYVHQVFKHTMT